MEVRLFNVKKTKEYEKMVLENNVQKILFRQLDNFWDGWNKEVISIKISQALGEMQENYLMSASTRLYKDGDMVFNPMHTVTWAIFLYRLSRLLYLAGNIYEADCVYYLNKIMNSVEWFYQVELPEHFMAEHPLGSVLGKAQYSDYLFVYQGTSIAGNRKKGKLYYPKLGKNVVLYANATILGETTIGNNVIVSGNTYIINEKVPDNCIVFGQSTNIVIKEKSEPEILEMTKHIWRW